MYKFKNVKKLLIEFSRGEGLSVPTDSIKFVKVDGDELSGSVPGGQGDGGESDVPTVESLMLGMLQDSPAWSSATVPPDAYFREATPGDDYDYQYKKIDNIEELFRVIVDDGWNAVFPAYLTNTTPREGSYYIPHDWQNNIPASTVMFFAIEGNEEYAYASGGIG